MHIDVNGAQLWFDVDGPALVVRGMEMRRRPTLVLVHGGPGGFDHSYFKPDFAELTAIAQVVYLDLRDHGRSSRSDLADWDYTLAADDICVFCDTLGIEKPVVLGHSFGGPVVITYGSRHPDHASGLILQSTFARFDLDRVVQDFRRIGGDEIAEIVRRSYTDDPSLSTEEWRRAWKLFGPWVPDPVMRARTQGNARLASVGGAVLCGTDVREALRDIQCPTLVCVGDLDPITPVAVARSIADALAPGIGELCVLREAGHFPWRDVPDEYWRVLKTFITRLDA